MRFVRARNLDAHDRRRFIELRPAVDADVVVENEFNNYVDKISTARWMRRLRLTAGPMPRLVPDNTRRRKAVHE